MIITSLGNFAQNKIKNFILNTSRESWKWTAGTTVSHLTVKMTILSLSELKKKNTVAVSEQNISITGIYLDIFHYRMNPSIINKKTTLEIHRAYHSNTLILNTTYTSNAQLSFKNVFTHNLSNIISCKLSSEVYSLMRVQFFQTWKCKLLKCTETKGDKLLFLLWVVLRSSYKETARLFQLFANTYCVRVNPLSGKNFC